MTKKIAIIVGSLRKGSYNRKIAKTLIELAAGKLDMEIIEIGNLPLYNEDTDNDQAKEWNDFRNKIKKADGVLFITPEYNRSVPGVLKNAIDVGSRPYGGSAWEGKPGAVISSSPGAIVGFGANQHLRQCFVFLNVPCMQQPEAYISNVAKLFDDQDKMTNDDTKEFLNKFLASFSTWVDKNANVK